MPADHKIFKELNSAQWLWYFHNFMEDCEEEFNNHRDMVEYHASFIEPEAVRKIRESRDKAIEIPDKEFQAGLERSFGRALPGQKRSEGNIEAVDPSASIANYKAITKAQQVGAIKGTDYKHWLESDLG